MTIAELMEAAAEIHRDVEILCAEFGSPTS